MKNPAVSDDSEVLAALKLLTEHPSYKTLVEEMERLETKFFANLARGLATNTAPVDQRVIDEKRGFWKGVRWALVTFPTLSSKEHDRFIKEAVKEADERGGSH